MTRRYPNFDFFFAPNSGCACHSVAAAGVGRQDNGRKAAVEDHALFAGTSMTSEGPLPYAGNILDNPDVLWMDDHWTREEVGASQTDWQTVRQKRRGNL